MIRTDIKSIIPINAVPAAVCTSNKVSVILFIVPIICYVLCKGDCLFINRSANYIISHKEYGKCNGIIVEAKLQRIPFVRPKISIFNRIAIL